MGLKKLLRYAKENYGFVSPYCECHFVLPYGFVPEADCKNHDNQKVVQKLNGIAELILGDFD